MTEMIAFGAMAAVTIGGAAGVIAARNVFVAALWLVLSFLGVAGLYALLGADFLAATQVLIYVGAISVLILFAIMLTHNVMQHERANNRQAYLAFLIASSIVTSLGMLAYRADWPLTWGDGAPAAATVAHDAAGASDAGGATAAVSDTTSTSTVDAESDVKQDDNIVRLGQALMSEHLLAFEVISLVLLVALIGAIVIARD